MSTGQQNEPDVRGGAWFLYLQEVINMAVTRSSASDNSTEHSPYGRSGYARSIQTAWWRKGRVNTLNSGSSSSGSSQDQIQLRVGRGGGEEIFLVV